MTSSGLLFTTDSYVRHRWYCIIWRYVGLSTIHVQFLISEHELAVLAFVCEFLPLFPILFFHEACRTEKSLRNISFRHSDALGAVAANGTWMVPKTRMSLLRLVNRKSDLAPPQKSVPFLPNQQPAMKPLQRRVPASGQRQERIHTMRHAELDVCFSTRSY